MAELDAVTDKGIDLSKLDDFSVTRANFQLLRSFIVSELAKLGFRGNEVSVEGGQIQAVGKTTGKAFPYAIRVKTKLGVVELLDGLVEFRDQEAQGIMLPTFEAARNALSAKPTYDELRKINPRSVMELLRGEKVGRLISHCRILEDADAYNYALLQRSREGRVIVEAFSFAHCYHAYCVPPSVGVEPDKNLERDADIELMIFRESIRVREMTPYLYEPEGINSIVVLYVPKDDAALPLTSAEVAEAATTQSFDAQSNREWSTDFSEIESDERDGETAQLDFDADFNRDVEVELSDLCDGDLKVRILQNEYYQSSRMTMFPFQSCVLNPQALTGVETPQEIAKILHEQGIQPIKRNMSQSGSLSNGALLLVVVEGIHLGAYAVPAAEAGDFACY